MRLFLAALALVWATVWAAGPLWAFDPTSSYRTERIAGWTVLWSPDYASAPEDRLVMARYVRQQLRQVAQVLPKRAVTRLRQVPIWIEYEPSPNHGAAYHPDASWLAENGENPAKANAVELGFADYLDRNEQPAIVLHELAHAWHHQVLGDDHEGVFQAYRAARRMAVYRRGRDVYGKRGRAYALRDEFEYFAEATESYFLRNDYQPFNRAELKAFDPQGYALIKRVWNIAP